MALSQVVSVRFTIEELKHLQSQQLEGESLSSTIKRLILGDLSCKQSVNTSQADSLKVEILEAVNQLIEPLRDALLEDREKLERLANTVNDITTFSMISNNVNTVNSVNTNEKFHPLESKTRDELRQILKDLGIKYPASANKSKLIELCLKENFESR